MSKLKIGEYKVYSADQLLKERPNRLEGLEIVCNEAPDNYSIHVNEVNVFCRDYQIVYGKNYVIIHFKDKYDNTICNITAVGSSEYKKDECFIVGYNNIISQTCLRVINGHVNDAMN